MSGSKVEDSNEVEGTLSATGSTTMYGARTEKSTPGHHELLHSTKAFCTLGAESTSVSASAKAAGTSQHVERR